MKSPTTLGSVIPGWRSWVGEENASLLQVLRYGAPPDERRSNRTAARNTPELVCSESALHLPAPERSRQPEPWEHTVLETGQGTDQIPGEGEDVEAHPVADAVGGARVCSERRLTVSSRRHEVEPPARSEDAGAEAGHDVTALASAAST
jgi:hypothetical protein